MNQKKRSRKTNGKQETQKAVSDMNENKCELTKDFQDEGIQEDSENLDVVAPEGNSFEFLTQPEESYVEVITYEKEVSQFKIPGEIDNKKKEAAGRRKSRRSYASVVSESENEDQDQPEDEVCKDISGVLGDDSVIICDEEVNSVRNPAPEATGSTSSKENDVKRITRSSLKNENEDKNSEEIENGDSVESVEDK